MLSMIIYCYINISTYTTSIDYCNQSKTTSLTIKEHLYILRLMFIYDMKKC